MCLIGFTSVPVRVRDARRGYRACAAVTGECVRCFGASWLVFWTKTPATVVVLVSDTKCLARSVWCSGLWNAFSLFFFFIQTGLGCSTTVL